MSRKIAGQVPTNVSRLLRGGYLKEEPVWFQAVLAHPPVSPRPRSPIPRPADDLPPSLLARRRRLTRTAELPATEAGAQSGSGTSSKPPRMSAKRLRTFVPSLSPQPIFYLQDRVRRQFFRDHPWEAYRPRTLVEMDKVVTIDKSSPLGAPEEARELRAWGRNPGPEDVVSCTIHLHQKHGLSLSQAYHHTIASYHALRAEHETASRYAVLEAEAYGAQFGRTESTRIFLREHKRIFGTTQIEPEPTKAAAAPLGAEGGASSSVATSSRTAPPSMIPHVADDQLGSGPTMAVGAEQVVPMYVEPRGKDRAKRIKNVDDTFTEGGRYLDAAISTTQAALARLRSQA